VLLQKLGVECAAMDPFRICHIRSKPLFECLADASEEDLTGMIEFAEYVQLPTALVLAVHRHREARQQLGLPELATAPESAAAATLLPERLCVVLARSTLLGALLLAAEAATSLPTFHCVYPRGFRSIPVDNPSELWSSYVMGLCGAPLQAFEASADLDAPELAAAQAAGLLVAGHPRHSLACATGETKRYTAPLAAMAMRGDLGTLQWLHEQGWACHTASAAAVAAGRGHIPVLEYLLPDVPPHVVEGHVVPAAAEGGQLAALQFLSAHGVSLGSALAPAVEHGQPQLVRWLVEEHKLPVSAAEHDCPVAAAAGRGDLPTLQYLMAHGHAWHESACAAAAAGGHLQMLQWLRAHSPPCPWNSQTCWMAVQDGHLDVLQWARAQDPPCPWDDNLLEAAVFGEQVHMMSYLVEQGHEVTAEACDEAVRWGRLEALKWLRSREPPCPWSDSSIQEAFADSEGHASLAARAKIRAWLAEHTSCVLEADG
jgi:hypothetical protein